MYEHNFRSLPSVTECVAFVLNIANSSVADKSVFAMYSNRNVILDLIGINTLM